MDKPLLGNTRRDIVAAVVRGIAGACPYAGGMLSEALDVAIPGQKMERVLTWLSLFDAEIEAAQADIDLLKKRIGSPEGLDLLEDGILQASRALSDERRRQIARMLSMSLTQKELKYAESKRLFGLLAALTDPEIVLLRYYSSTPTLGSARHRALMDRYPEILRPISTTLGSSQEEMDRAAIQASYRRTLIRLGLLSESDRLTNLTGLGGLLLRFIGQAPE